MKLYSPCSQIFPPQLRYLRVRVRASQQSMQPEIAELTKIRRCARAAAEPAQFIVSLIANVRDIVGGFTHGRLFLPGQSLHEDGIPGVGQDFSKYGRDRRGKARARFAINNVDGLSHVDHFS